MRAFMDEPEPAVAATAACRMLRCKTAFGATHGYSDWRAGASATAGYWCLATMQTAGPDDTLVHPDRCQSGRGCYRPDE